MVRYSASFLALVHPNLFDERDVGDFMGEGDVLGGRVDRVLEICCDVEFSKLFIRRKVHYSQQFQRNQN